MMYERARELAEDRTVVAAVLLSLLGLGLRLRGLGTDSLWYDELYSLTLARMPLPDMIWMVAADDLHPPLYYLFLKLYGAIAGHSELMLRLPSAIIGAATIYAIYRLGTTVMDRRTGLVAAGLLAVSPLHIYWSQQVRQYSPVILLGVLLSLALVRYLRGTDSIRRYLGIGLVFVYTHVLGWLVIGAHLVVVLASGYTERIDRERITCFLRDGFGLLVLAWLPWAILFLQQIQEAVTDYWVPVITLDEVERTLLMQLGQEPATLLALPLLAVGLGRLIWAVRDPDRADWPGSVLVLAWLFVPAVALLLVSVLVTPLFYHRFLLLVLPATLLTVAAAIRTDRAWLQYGVGGLMIALALVSLGTWTVNAELHQDWETAATYLGQHAGPDDVAVFYDQRIQAGIEYYDDPAYRNMGFPEAFPPLDQEPYNRSALREHATVWIVINHDLDVDEGQDGDDILWRHDGYERVVEPLEQWYTVEQVLTDRLDNIEIYRLERR